MLDAGKIRIADSAYVYFSWDKDGIVAYRDPQSINTTKDNIDDSAIFNKYGLSIVSDGTIKLRAGYSFNGHDGLITSEDEMGNDIGFYLYNNKGDAIFSTTTGEERESAIIQLIGEMFISNSLEVQKSKGDSFTQKIKTFTQGTFTYTPFMTEMPQISTSTYIDPEDPSVIYKYYDATNSSLNDNMLAAYLLHNENISEVTIRRGSNNTLFTKQNDSENLQNNKYCGISEARFEQKISKKIEVFLRNPSTTSTIYYFEVTNLDGNNPKFYFMNQNGQDIELLARDIKIFNGVEEVSPVISTGAIEETVSNLFERQGGEYVSISPKTVYRVNGSLYQDRIPGGGGSELSNSTIGLYLNNPVLPQSTYVPSDASGHGIERLFSICVQDGSTSVANVFTVLKNGSAYFGGHLQSEKDALSLSDKVAVENPQIEIGGDGRLFISFGSIFDPSNKSLSLSQYIANQIQDSTGPVYAAIQQATQSLQDQIQSALGSIDGFHDHAHYVGWGAQRWYGAQHDADIINADLYLLVDTDHKVHHAGEDLTPP